MKYLSIPIGIGYDTRDFYNFPTKGMRVGLNGGFLNIIDDEDHSISQLYFQFSGYKSLNGSFNLRYKL